MTGVLRTSCPKLSGRIQGGAFGASAPPMAKSVNVLFLPDETGIQRQTNKFKTSYRLLLIHTRIPQLRNVAQIKTGADNRVVLFWVISYHMQFLCRCAFALTLTYCAVETERIEYIHYDET